MSIIPGELKIKIKTGVISLLIIKLVIIWLRVKVCQCLTNPRSARWQPWKLSHAFNAHVHGLPLSYVRPYVGTLVLHALVLTSQILFGLTVLLS